MLPLSSGLNNITTIFDFLYINNNHALPNLSGLENLTGLDGYLRLLNNDALTDLTALENLTTLGNNFLEVSSHALLTSLEGLENILASEIDNVKIQNNPMLSTCHVKSICDYDVVNNTSTISGNDTGCATDTEIDDRCTNCPIELTISTNPIDGDNIYAETSIETNGTVNILAGTTVTFRAGIEIILNPNFTATETSDFRAYIDDTDCMLPPAPTPLLDNEEEHTYVEDNRNSDKETNLESFPSIVLAPNPTEGIINISTDQEVSLKIFDALGQLLIEYPIAPSSIDLSKYREGIYFLSFSKNGITSSKRIVKI